MNNTNRAHRLIEKSKNIATFWGKFLRLYQTNPQNLYCFYEGKEDCFYYNIQIRYIIFRGNEQGNLQHFACEGKDVVLGLLEHWKTQHKYSSAWVAFFVDRDYDPPPSNHDNLYVTPCYSVENFYVSVTAFSKILKNEFLLNEGDEDYDAAIELYRNQITNFFNETKKIHAWIYIQRQKEKSNPSGYNLNLKDDDHKKWLKVSVNRVQVLRDFSNFISEYPNSHPVSEEELSEVIEWLSSYDPPIILRGKYLIFFLREFLNKLAQDKNTKDGMRQFFKTKRTNVIHLNISENNTLSHLSHYADIPSCLYDFLVRLSKQNKG